MDKEVVEKVNLKMSKFQDEMLTLYPNPTWQNWMSLVMHHMFYLEYRMDKFDKMYAEGTGAIKEMLETLISKSGKVLVEAEEIRELYGDGEDNIKKEFSL